MVPPTPGNEDLEMKKKQGGFQYKAVERKSFPILSCLIYFALEAFYFVKLWECWNIALHAPEIAMGVHSIAGAAEQPATHCYS